MNSPFPFLTLSLQKIALMRADRVLYKNVSFIVNSGQILWLQGKNGSGKTTLLRSLAGFMPFTSGGVTLSTDTQTLSPQTYPDEWKQSLDFLGHNNGLSLDMTPKQNLEYLLTLMTGKKALLNEEIIETLHLKGLMDIAVSRLSQGQKRRVALARIAMLNRPVWLLDEPFVGLDTVSVEICSGLLQNHIKKGGLVILTSHTPPQDLEIISYDLENKVSTI